PGIFAENGPGSKGGTSEVSIRGMSSKYALILVNGKPQGSNQGYYNGYGRGAEFGWLPPMSSIERIEVVRGPMSSLYGSDALGGVINVITKEGDEQWQGELSADTVIQGDNDSGDSRNARYHVSGPLTDSLSVKVQGNVYKRDEDSRDRGYKDVENFNNSATLDWQATDDQSFQLDLGRATQESKGTAERSGERALETERDFYSLSHEIDWGDAKTTSFFQNEIMENITQVAEYERSTFNTITHLPIASTEFVLGAQYREQQTKNPLRAKNKATLERWDMALFGESHWSLSDDFTLTLGLRWVDDENYGDEYVPRLYGVYQVSDSFTVKGGVSRGYRTPDLKQGDSQWVEGGGGRRIDGADIGNSALTPEFSTNYELVANWQGENGVSAGLTVYQTDFDDRIQKNIICQESSDKAYDCSYLGVAYQRVYQYQNVSEAELSGIEASLTYTTGELSASVNYTYSDSEIKSGSSAGRPLNNLPESVANLSLSWQASEAIDVWGKLKYRSDTLEGGTSQIPSYSMVDVGGSFQLNDNIDVYAGVYNLFDEQIDYSEYRRVLDGRRYSLGLNLRF
ncbi:MAG: TonB-dependent receptor, partial [Cellvibrionaceae bacterium]|nr:TonB-dependent receptor [Cellvibrionaceae bacterium]